MSTPHVVTLTGRNLIRTLCSYEVIALALRRTAWGNTVKPLSWWVQRYRWHPIGTPIIFILVGWLLWHLFVEQP